MYDQERERPFRYGSQIRDQFLRNSYLVSGRWIDVLCLITSPNKGLFTHADDVRKRNKFAVCEYEVKSNTGDVHYNKFYKKETTYKFHQM
jgi:hypothetical protein